MLRADRQVKEGHRLSHAALALQSDDRLVALVRSGSELAFETIVTRYRRPLLGYCSARLGTNRAEDTVQQTLLNAHTAMLHDDRSIQLKPWLYRIAHNLCINALKKHGWDHEPLDEGFGSINGPEEAAAEHDRIDRVVGRVGELPERQRAALLMREFEGRSYQEIAEHLGATAPMVRGLINRARVRLRDGLGALVPLPGLQAWLASLTARSADPQRIAHLVAGARASSGLAQFAVAAALAGTVATGVAVEEAAKSRPTSSADGKTRTASILHAGPASAFKSIDRAQKDGLRSVQSVQDELSAVLTELDAAVSGELDAQELVALEVELGLGEDDSELEFFDDPADDATIAGLDGSFGADDTGDGSIGAYDDGSVYGYDDTTASDGGYYDDGSSYGSYDYGDTGNYGDADYGGGTDYGSDSSSDYGYDSGSDYGSDSSTSDYGTDSSSDYGYDSGGDYGSYDSDYGSYDGY